jgi:hypothetical protein
MESFVTERLATWRAIDKEHFPKTKDFTTVVVKSHIILEQHLTRLISHYCRVPTYLENARLQFSQKIQLAKAFVYFPVPDEIWRSLELMNSIRNDVAHNLNPPKLANHITQARALPACSPHGKDSKAVRKVLKTDSGMIGLLFGYCSGFLQALDVTLAAIEKSKKDSWTSASEKHAKKKGAVKSKPKTSKPLINN